MKRSHKNLLFRLSEGTGVGRLARWRGRGDLRIVTYHGVEANEDRIVNYDRLQVDPLLFRQQVEALAHRFRVRPLGELLGKVAPGAPWPERSLAITFDDGYRNNAEIAAPILRQIGVPATFFVTHSYLAGCDHPWWYMLRAAFSDARRTDVEAPDGSQRLPLRSVEERIRAARLWETTLVHESMIARQGRLQALLAGLGVAPRQPYAMMTSDDVRLLVAAGFEVGTHTVHHLSFRHEPIEALESDLQAALHAMTALGIRGAPMLAYPYGHVPESFAPLRALLEKLGVVAAVTTEMGANSPQADRLLLRRYDLHGNRSVAGTLALCSGLVRGG